MSKVLKESRVRREMWVRRETGVWTESLSVDRQGKTALLDLPGPQDL